MLTKNEIVSRQRIFIGLLVLIIAVSVSQGETAKRTAQPAWGIPGRVNPIQFNDEYPLVDEQGRIIQPKPQRIDVSKRPAGRMKPIGVGDWTVAVWNFPAWNPEGSHPSQLAREAPLRIPLLYDSTNPEVVYNGVMYYRNDDRRVMDWHIKWMVEHGINLVMFDWYPSSSMEKFDNSPKHKSINTSIEVGFLGKKKVGGPPTKTNPYADKIKFIAMWTNHGNAWIPDGTMEYACENFLNQPNYYKVDGKHLIIIHAAGLLLEEHGKSEKTKLEDVRVYLERQRAIAKSYGYDVYIAIGHLLSMYSGIMKEIGFDGVFNYINEAQPERVDFVEVQALPCKAYPQGQKGKIHNVDFDTQLFASHLKNWDVMNDIWGREFFPTVTPREDWRHWRLNDRMLYYHGGTPEQYERTLRAAKDFVEKTQSRKFVTVGIWNEFYEDCYLEPDLQYGTEYLKRIKRVFEAKK